MKMKTSYWFKDDPVPNQKMTQCQVKTKVFLVKPKDLDYLQEFLLRVVAT
jgi:hypothetical protein